MKKERRRVESVCQIRKPNANDGEQHTIQSYHTIIDNCNNNFMEEKSKFDMLMKVCVTLERNTVKHL